MTDFDAILRSSLENRYAIEGEIGRGGMAVVYRARDLKHKRDVAIKVLRPELSELIAADRFHREVELSARLTHPHILPLYDSGEAGGLLYYVMPLVDGETLRALLERVGPLPIADAVRIAEEVAEALHYAHERGIIHRDVKPANIMLSGRHPMLSDFGIAHLTEDADTILTRTGISVGTPTYMSPEQAAGDEPVTARSDVYALGCVLFEMLAGRPPFDAASHRAVLTSHMTERPPDIGSLRKDVPPALVDVVDRALEKEPADRFASAAEMATALYGARTDVEVTAPVRIHRWVRRHHGWRRAAIAAFFALGALGALALWRDSFRPTSPAVALSDPRGSYAVIGFRQADQPDDEVRLASDAADRIAYFLDGWQNLDATLEHELNGTMLELGIEGPTLASLADGLEVTREMRVGTLLGVRVVDLGDSLALSVRQYDVATGESLGPSRQQIVRDGDLQAAAFAIAAEILDIRGEDPATLKGQSNSTEAWQEFLAARGDLYDWRLEEAEAGFRQAIAYDPGFAAAHHYLAVTLFWQTTRDPERRRRLAPEIQRTATEALRRAEETPPSPGMLDHIAGFQAFLSGDYATARSRFRERLARDSSDVEAWLFLGAVEWEDPWLARTGAGLRPRGDPNAARRAFVTSGRIWPDVPISRGLQFEMLEDLTDYLASPLCRSFAPPEAEAVLPPFEKGIDVAWVHFFPLVEADTIRWAPCMEEAFAEGTFAEKRVRYLPMADRLYEDVVDEIERWASLAPDEARPREEWADLLLWRRARLACDADTARAGALTRDALEQLELAIELAPSPTTERRIAREVLALAAGRGDAPAAVVRVEALLPELDAKDPQAAPLASQPAANAYLAAGMPSRATERMRDVWSTSRAWGSDPDTDELYEYSDELEALGEARVLGAVGADGPRIARLMTEVERAWSDGGRDPRRSAVLRKRSALGERHASQDIRPALAVNDAARRLWLADFGDLEPPSLPEWEALLAPDRDDAQAWLEPTLERVATMHRPFAMEYVLAGLVAERAGADSAAAEMFGRVGSCPLDVMSLDVGWGLSRLAGLRRARALERLGRLDEAHEAYGWVAEEWRNAGPEVRDELEEARAGAARTRSARAEG